MPCLLALTPPMARPGRRWPSTSVPRRGRTVAALPRRCFCGRRHLIGASSAAALLPLLAPPSRAAPPIDPEVMLERVHPPRPDWYEEFYAVAMDQGMKSYEAEVAEALPVEDNSMDVVIGTLVLCSVNNIDMSLREIKRVLKPGGLYLFIEHVAAPDGSLLRLVQGAFDPLQQFVADGCHLTRKTGENIRDVGFSSLSLDSVRLSNAYIISPHVYGVASK
nr:unnamed protein product [Digitaria exilis]